MHDIAPTYTAANCHASYRLIWTVSVFWQAPFPVASWPADTVRLLSREGLRVWSHRFLTDRTSQFLVSAVPSVSPAGVVRLLKGRLYSQMRHNQQAPASRRNYFISSVGRRSRRVIERYVESQLDHHRMADPRVQEFLGRFQVVGGSVDLSQPQSSSHGRYVYNLHLVLVHAARWMEVDGPSLARRNDMVLAAAARKGHRVSAIGVFADHIHVTLGCEVTQSPEDVALGYLNNLAYVEGMRPVYQAGYYVGTFGEYDLNAIRLNLGEDGTG
jgi:REP element-mobilizing transposase RayT